MACIALGKIGVERVENSEARWRDPLLYRVGFSLLFYCFHPSAPPARAFPTCAAVLFIYIYTYMYIYLSLA